MIDKKGAGGPTVQMMPPTLYIPLARNEHELFGVRCAGRKVAILTGEEYTAIQTQKESAIYLLDEADSNISDINCKSKALIVSRKITDSIRGDEW